MSLTITAPRSTHREDAYQRAAKALSKLRQDHPELETRAMALRVAKTAKVPMGIAAAVTASAYAPELRLWTPSS